MGLFSRFFGTPSREDFARSVIEALKNDGVTAPITLDAATFSLRIEDASTKRFIHLGNFYAQFLKENRSARDEFVRGVVRRYKSQDFKPQSIEEVRQRLLPQVRSRCYFSFSNLGAKANGIDANLQPFRALTDSVVVGLVLDYPETMRGVDPALFRTFQMSEDEAIALAMANLRARTEPQFAQHAPGVWVSAWQDTYDATRILLPEIITALPVRGRPVVMIPHRNLLVVTGDMDPDGLIAMAALGSTAFEEPQAISVTPLVRDGDVWRELELDAGHPAARDLARVQLQMLSHDYAQQKELLEAVAVREGDDTFVATFVATQHSTTGALASYCTWSEGVKQTLPQTERLAFVGDDEDGPKSLGFVQWQDALRVMGPAMRPTGDYPPRYAVDGFPSESQLREMGIERL